MKKSRIVCMMAAMLPGALMAQAAELSAEQAKLVQEIPTQDSKESNEIFVQLGKDLDTVVPHFISKLSTSADDANTTARYALGGLVWTLGKTGTDAQKQQLATHLADGIAKVDGVEPKSFLIEQLQFLGESSIAEKLYPLMADDELGERAIRTLMALEPAAFDKQLATALDDANTTAVKTALLNSLAEVGAGDQLAKVTPLASDADVDVRNAALNAMASTADPSVRDALKAETAKSETFYDQLAGARYLDYAKNLAKGENRKLAAEVCNDILNMDENKETLYLKSLALTTLTDVTQDMALETLRKYVKHDDEKLRGTALANLNRFEEEGITEILLEELTGSPDAEVTVAVLLALGNRGDGAALPAVEKLYTHEDETIAATAVATAGKIDRKAAVSGFMNLLKGDELPKAVADALVKELGSAPVEQTTAAAAANLNEASAQGKVLLVQYLGERRASSQKKAVFAQTSSDDNKVRSAAYEALGRVAESSDLQQLLNMMLQADKASDRNAARKAFVSVARDAGDDQSAWSGLLTTALSAADEKSKESLFITMSQLADKANLPKVIEASKDESNADLQDAAVRALSEWQSADTQETLLAIARESKKANHQVLAVRGYAQQAANLKDSPEKRFTMLTTILRVAKSDDELKNIITQLGDYRSHAALKAVMPYLVRESVKAEASAAVLKIAMPAKEGEPGLRGADTAEALIRALESVPGDQKARRHIEKQIYALQNEINLRPIVEDSEGFIELFNGKDLTGWVGSTDGYSVENGSLVCREDGGGTLFTDRQFGDFVLRLEFKIQAGANNGVGIRAPLIGDAAYNGMEIQLLDDKDERYKDIKDWQRHGSVYGISAAQERADLKIGEWNTEEISVIGRQIKVTVNGKVVTDVNLDDAAKAGYPSGKDHPGAQRNNGHIGFLGHGHRVEFRNIRVKNVANQAPEGFITLFNGKNFDGWKGLVANPIKRKEMSESQLKEAQAKADKEMNDHWSVINGLLYFDGDGSHLCTIKDYGNFEMHVDWAIPPGGDNGIYLRGTPQVQIWDPRYWPQGSGGLYNNQKGTSDPLVLADHPIGQWNHFFIRMVDEKVTVQLNGKTVVDEVVLENYWDRKQPIFPVEQIELQSHGSPAWFRNVYLRELP